MSWIKPGGVLRWRRRSFRELLKKLRVPWSRKRTRYFFIKGLTQLIFLQVLRASLELGQVRQEIDRRIAEKEEEFDNSR